jgi:hypothetical protein
MMVEQRRGDSTGSRTRPQPGSLAPLSFEDALKALANTPGRREAEPSTRDAPQKIGSEEGRLSKYEIAPGRRLGRGIAFM